MKLTKDGITIEVSHPSDVQRYKAIGYVPVEKPAKPEPDKTPDELNAEAIKAVNESKGTPSAKPKAAPKSAKGGEK